MESSIIHNRLRKNLKQRKALLKGGKLTAYRLYEKDIPEYPYIIDIYNEFAVIYEKGSKESQKAKIDSQDLREKFKSHKEDIIKALIDIFNITQNEIIFKTRENQTGLNQYEKLAKKDDTIVVRENGMEFICNLYDYLDTGLFLDHRPLREIIKKEARGKNVLNLFSYTGSISVAAAVGGGNVTTIDMSNTYLSWAEENFLLNDIEPEDHEFIKADVVKLLTLPMDKVFDLIVLDPPSFSNSKSMRDSFNVQTDHPKMVHNLMKSLNPGGVLYFSNNFRKFKMDQSILDQYSVQDISLKSIPRDFRDMKIHVIFKIMHK